LARTGYLAGGDDARADALDGCLRDPDVRAVVCARGGYGVMRILDRLDASALRRDPKLVVGFSDCTALLCWAARAGVASVHGPVVSQLGELPEADIAWLLDLMTNPAPPPVPMSLSPIGARASGVREGRLLGGNLCILAHLAGTPYLPDVSGAVLLLEDVGERPYRIDRYLTQLGLAGALSPAAAALVGDFVACVEPCGSAVAEVANDGKPGAAELDHGELDARVPAALEVIGERLRHYDIPGLAGAPLAHGSRNLALPFGARCQLDFERGRLTLVDGAVA
jgi:muramoyltetrapeptide carboxypeptidase